MCNRTAYHCHSGKHQQFREFRKHWKQQQFKYWKQAKFGGSQNNYPPVNVKELDDQYEIYIYAAGYSKADFGVAIKDNLLVISAKKKESEKEDSKTWKRVEFNAKGFERRFELNEKIDKEVIIAQYEEGVLKVTLPKLSGYETLRQEIEVN